MESVMRSTISYPERGPWGTPGYPGACSGHLVSALIDTFEAKSVADPTEGSGTTRDVCRDRGLTYWGSDLKDGFDLGRSPLMTAVPDRAQLVFVHPPYFRAVRYSGGVWGRLPDARDLSHENSWTRYLDRLVRWIAHAASGVRPNGHLALLIGDVPSEDGYYSALAELMHLLGPDQVASVIVRHPDASAAAELPQAAHEILTTHEYCLIIRPEKERLAYALSVRAAA
jgi:hypothetical protein